jgi:SAM-dependent methyltransferase
MMACVSGIYDEPELYELACAYREVPAEVTALLSWCATHFAGEPACEAVTEPAAEPVTEPAAAAAAEPVTEPAAEPASQAPRQGTGVRSVLELAAGPAEHARELARRGLRSTALDRSPAMCAYAASRAAADGIALDVVAADMRDFLVTEPDGTPRHFDLAITMLNSACHLFTLEDLVRHIGAVAGHLRHGGLYVVELAHPADFFAPVPRTSSEWTIDVDGWHADVRWGGRGDRIDPVTQITDEHMSISATAKDGTVRTVTDVVPNRFWTLTEFTAALALANAHAWRAATGNPASAIDAPGAGQAADATAAATLELVATYGDFDQTTALDAPTAWRMILIMRRSGGAEPAARA